MRKRKFNKYISALFSTLIGFSYVIMAGNGISARRALIMFLLTIIGTLLGRSVDLLNSLGVAVIILLTLHPLWILNSSFLLSVFAILGIGIFGVLGVTLVPLPIVLLTYYSISPYSYLVNAILVPLIPMLMTFAAIGSLLSFFSVTRWLVPVIFIPCKGFLYLLELICDFFGRLPKAEWIVGKPSIARIIIFYGILCLALFIYQQVRKNAEIVKENDYKQLNYKPNLINRIFQWMKKIVISEGIFFLAILFFLLFPNKTNQITVLDVGQGDGIYIQSKDIDCFVDGGSSDVGKVGNYRILPFLKAKGVQKIDYWFVSHLDEDHTNGLLELLQYGYPIKAVVFSTKTLKYEQENALIQELEHRKIKIIELPPDCVLSCGAFRLISLNSGKSNFNGANDNSLCLFLQAREFSGLLCGDISAAVEEEICRRYPDLIRNITWYKCNHHGSKYSSCEAFLKLIQPKIITISCGKNNSYGHPHCETIFRLENYISNSHIYRTDKCGQVTITMDNNDVKAFIDCGIYRDIY